MDNTFLYSKAWRLYTEKRQLKWPESKYNYLSYKNLDMCQTFELDTNGTKKMLLHRIVMYVSEF